MKHLSSFAKSSIACGALAVAAIVSSCGSTSTSLAPVRAAERLSHSPVSSVFSHNDVNSPKLRDCYEVGPLPERTRRALVTWLHNSTIKEFSYINPQYYITTVAPDGRGEVVWALCSDNQGHLVGVLVPRTRTSAAWDLPTIGSYKLFVCDTPEKEALSNAIMESLADAGYDNVRINILKATGVTEMRHLISKPLSAEQQRQVEKERKANAKVMQKSADDDSDDTTDDDDEDDSTDTDSSESSISSDDSDSLSTDDDSSSSSDDEDDSSSSDDDEDSSSDDDSSSDGDDDEL